MRKLWFVPAWNSCPTTKFYNLERSPESSIDFAEVAEDWRSDPKKRYLSLQPGRSYISLSCVPHE
jgi:hypothetical protein